VTNFGDRERSFVKEVGPLPKCPPFEILKAYEQAVLPEPAQVEVGLHVGHCSLCRMLLKDFASLEEPHLSPGANERIRQQIPISDSSVSSRRSRLWLVGGAVAAATVMVAILLGYSFHQEKKTTVASVVPPVPAPSHLVQLELEKLPPPSSLQEGLVFRGGAVRPEPTAEELGHAFHAYQTADYRDAATQFSALARRYPKSDIPVLYLGVSQLFLGENQAALSSLSAAEIVARPSRKDVSSWYRAVAAMRVQSSEAKALFESLCGWDQSAYAQRACQIKAQLDK
jgi:hypothetical protein